MRNRCFLHAQMPAHLLSNVASYEFFSTNKGSDIIMIKVFGDAGFFKDQVIR
jgi:hypothetical protein